MNFCGYYHMFPRNFQLLEDFSKLNFCVAGIVSLSSIKVIDAILEGDLNDFFVFLISLRLIVDHVSE
jgi:hypothetical protein